MGKTTPTSTIFIDHEFLTCCGIIGLDLVFPKEVGTLDTGAVDVDILLLLFIFLFFRPFEVSLFLRFNLRFGLDGGGGGLIRALSGFSCRPL